jgi:hypothetical protein
MRTAITIIAGLAFLAPLLASAQPLDAEGERFKTQLLKVYSAPTAAGIRSLLHEKSLACMRKEPEYERYIMRAETLTSIPTDAKVSVEGFPSGAKAPFRGFNFPIQPSHKIAMEYGRKVDPADKRVTTSSITDEYIARDASGWHLIFACPQPEGMRHLKDMGLLE